MPKYRRKRKPEPAQYRYFIINKPYGILSQFTDPSDKNRTLGMLYDFPKDVYPVGRLDKDSEGLILITNDRRINHRLLDPQFQHEREYWSQVQGEITEEALHLLKEGIEINIDGKQHHSKPAKAEILEPQPQIPEREPPISPRGQWPLAWIRLILTEGKNRQVRRMTAKVGLPTLRLIRVRVANLQLNHLPTGKVHELTHAEVYQKLFNE